MGISKFIDYTWCFKAIEVGACWSFPAESQNYFMGTKVRTHHNLTLYLVFLTVDIGRPPTVLSFRCANCLMVIDGAPTHFIDCHKPICKVCDEYNISIIEHMGKMI